MTSPQQPIVNIQSLSRSFGSKKALDNISLQVKPGEVFGIVGENGAGKTTLIKHILGLYKAQTGSVSVFGLDPVKNPRQVLSQIGYLSEEPDLPGWMSVAQFMNYMAGFYDTWDQQYADNLLKMFNVDVDKKIDQLSKGQKARVGLCAAQAHRPQLLLLDEPSSGLDPVVRKEILSAVIKTVVDEGRSVIFSSHFLDEIERVCDRLVMFSQGKVLFSETMDDVLEKHFRVTVRAKDLRQLEKSKIPGFIYQQSLSNEIQLHCFSELCVVIDALQKQGIEIVETQAMSLNEIFMAYSPSQQNVVEAV